MRASLIRVSLSFFLVVLAPASLVLASTTGHRVIVLPHNQLEEGSVNTTTALLSTILTEVDGLYQIPADSVDEVLKKMNPGNTPIPVPMLCAALDATFHQAVCLTVKTHDLGTIVTAVAGSSGDYLDELILHPGMDTEMQTTNLQTYLSEVVSRLDKLTENDVVDPPAPEEVSVHEFFLVEKPPAIKGGVKKLYAYLSKNNLYPEMARRAMLEGDVIITFIVTAEGKPTEVTIEKERPAGLGFGEAAAKAVAAMKFTPGMTNGKAVPVRMQQVIGFRLQ